MSHLKLKLKTWSCDGCNYPQDFEPTQALMRWHFVDSTPETQRGVQWRRWASYDWSQPRCPSCLDKMWRAHDLQQKKDVSDGLISEPAPFDVTTVPLLTPEINADRQTVVFAPSDGDIDTLMEVTRPETEPTAEKPDAVPDVQLMNQAEADAADAARVAAGLPLLTRNPKTTAERDAYRADVRASLDKLAGANRLDESDATTSKIKTNLAGGALSDA